MTSTAKSRMPASHTSGRLRVRGFMMRTNFLRKLRVGVFLGASFATAALSVRPAHAQESPDSAVSDAMEKLVSQQETAWGR